MTLESPKRIAGDIFRPESYEDIVKIVEQVPWLVGLETELAELNYPMQAALMAVQMRRSKSLSHPMVTETHIVAMLQDESCRDEIIGHFAVIGEIEASGRKPESKKVLIEATLPLLNFNILSTLSQNARSHIERYYAKPLALHHDVISSQILSEATYIAYKSIGGKLS